MPVRGKAAGNKGQGSKWITRKRRNAIYARDSWACVWCMCPVSPGAYRTDEPATLDHMIPRTQGGCNTNHNLITACMSCNRARGDMPAHLYATTHPGAEARVLRAICTEVR